MKDYLEIDIEKKSGMVNHKTGEVIGFNCDIEFNCTCGWSAPAWGEFSKGNYSKTCPKCGAKKSYKI